MNAKIVEGLQQVEREAFAKGYLAALEAAEREVHAIMNEEPLVPHTELWGLLGGLSRLKSVRSTATANAASTRTNK